MINLIIIKDVMMMMMSYSANGKIQIIISLIYNDECRYKLNTDL
jgi:hypothetical protein